MISTSLFTRSTLRVARRQGSDCAAFGFTLIELMIVVAIVALLAAIAYPSFLGQVRLSRRSEAISEMSKVLQAQERFRSNNSNYSADVSSSTVAPGGLRLIPSTTVVDNYDTPSGRYNIAISGNTSTAYVVTASAKAGMGQTNDTNCQCMRVGWSGGTATYEAANATGGSCGGAAWSTSNAASCWKR
jgi:type IV pilus assembly protein PilE